MAATFTTTQSGASADYIQYLLDQAQKEDRNGSPVLLNFELSPNNVGFVKLTRGAYITLDTTVYPKWFTGYVTNDPEYSYLGTKAGVPTWGYKYSATDDSYILSLKPIGLLPPYINSTAGQIIKSLVSILDTSALFDVTNVADGPLIARYIVDPNKKFQDIITDLCKISAFRFVANDHKLYFEANDTTAATIAVDGASTNQHFTPSSLNIRPTTDPIVNDAIVVGAPEPQNFIKEWWVGDGFTGEFPLLSGLYGGDSSLLLHDDFSGEEIDTTNWDIFDALENLVLENGYLNVLGGNADGSFDIHLDSALVLPLEATLRLTHGVWDFVSTGSQTVAGIIAGLWTQAPNAAMTGCVYGLNVASGGGVLTLSPIVNGVVDVQTFTVDFTKRYVMRTLCNFSRTHRQDTTYSYLAADGSTGSYGGTAVDDVVTYSTWITEFDPVTAAITRQHQFVNANVAIGDTVAFANYILIADNDLHATVMGVTISVPMQGALYIQPAGVYDPTAFVPKLLGVNEIDSLDGLAPIATIQTNGSSVMGQTNGLGTPQFNSGDAKLAFFKDSIHLISYIPNPGDIVNLAYRRAGLSVGRVQNADSITAESTAWGDDGIRSLTRNDISPSPRTSRECRLAAGAIVQDFGFQHFEGDYTQYSLFEFTGEPQSGTVLMFNNLPATFPSYLQAELISQIDSTLFLRSPQEFFTHKVSFGKPDALSKALSRFYRAENQINFGLTTDAVATPDATQLADVALADIPDVTNIGLTGYDLTNFYFDTTVAAPSGGGFEVRLTDQSWGANDAKNLVSRVTSGTVFTLPRLRMSTGFVRAYTADHAEMSRYSAGVRVSFPSVPAAPTAITYDSKSTALVPTIPTIQRDIYGVEVYQISGPDTVDSATFTLVSDGADTRIAVVYGIDGTGAPLSESITLNGATPVSPVGTYAALAAVQLPLTDTARTVTIANGLAVTLGTIGPNAWHAEIGVLAYQVTDILLATALQNDPELSYVIGTNPPVGAAYSAFFFNMLNERSTPAVVEPVIPPAPGTATECLDVRNFGAIGDGVTDDTIAVQTALDTAHANYLAGSGSTKVCIPSGVSCAVGATLNGVVPTDEFGPYADMDGYPPVIIRSGVTLSVDGALIQTQPLMPALINAAQIVLQPSNTGTSYDFGILALLRAGVQTVGGPLPHDFTSSDGDISITNPGSVPIVVEIFGIGLDDKPSLILSERITVGAGDTVASTYSWFWYAYSKEITGTGSGYSVDFVSGVAEFPGNISTVASGSTEDLSLVDHDITITGKGVIYGQNNADVDDFVPMDTGAVSIVGCVRFLWDGPTASEPAATLSPSNFGAVTVGLCVDSIVQNAQTSVLAIQCLRQNILGLLDARPGCFIYVANCQNALIDSNRLSNSGSGNEETDHFFPVAFGNNLAGLPGGIHMGAFNIYGEDMGGVGDFDANSTISNNHVTNGLFCGIAVSGAIQYVSGKFGYIRAVKVIGNNCSGNGVVTPSPGTDPDVFGDGIFLGACQACSVLSNVCNGNILAPIHTVGCNNCNISDNSALGNGAGDVITDSGAIPSVLMSEDNPEINPLLVTRQGLAMSLGVTVTAETATGALDGVNTAFTLANIPVADTVVPDLNGTQQFNNPPTDTLFTVSGAVVTFTDPPPGGIGTTVLHSGGTGYSAGTVIVDGTPTVAATLHIDSVDGGGAVLTYHIVANGMGYTTGTNVATIGGAGTGFTIDITALNATLTFNYVYFFASPALASS